MDSKEVCRRLAAKRTGRPPNCEADIIDLMRRSRRKLAPKDIIKRLPQYKPSTIYEAINRLKEAGYSQEDLEKSSKSGRPNKNIITTDELNRKFDEMRRELLGDKIKEVEEARKLAENAKSLTTGVDFGMSVLFVGPQKKNANK